MDRSKNLLAVFGVVAQWKERTGKSIPPLQLLEWGIKITGARKVTVKEYITTLVGGYILSDVVYKINRVDGGFEVVK